MRTTFSKVNSLQDAVRHFINKNTEAYCSFIVAGSRMGVKGPICTILDAEVRGIRVRRYYVFFKREWLFKFKDIYRMPKEGFGQTVNYDILQQAARDPKKPSIAIVMPDGNIYYIKASQMLDWVTKHDTKRIPKDEAGLEASIPARLLHSIDDYYDW